MVPGAKWGLEMRGNEHRSKAPGRAPRPASARTAMNEVVCGAMMLAYERAGKWDEVRWPQHPLFLSPVLALSWSMLPYRLLSPQAKPIARSWPGGIAIRSKVASAKVASVLLVHAALQRFALAIAVMPPDVGFNSAWALWMVPAIFSNPGVPGESVDAV